MHIYMDCHGGLSGRAFWAALCHAGAGPNAGSNAGSNTSSNVGSDAPDARLGTLADGSLNVAALQEMLCAAGLPCRLALREHCGSAGAGCAVEVHCPEGEARKNLARATVMRDVLHRVPVSEAVRRKALAVLIALVEAEAHAAPCPPEDLHFEEAQAVHTLVVILGVCRGLEALGIERVLASPLPWVSGLGGPQGVAEGGQSVLPQPHMSLLPRPATARLLHGKPIVISGQGGGVNGTGEVVTALGAALVHVLAEDFSSTMQGRLRNVGVGYDGDGTSVRVLLLEDDAFAHAPHTSAVTGEDAVHRETVTMLESHIDHLSGEELGVSIQELAALPEVLDVLWLPGIGKKNRPAGSLRVLCMPCHVAVVERAVFAHTHSLGVRCQHMERAILPREACTVDTAAGALRAKRYSVDGADYVRVECDALRAAAEERQVTPLSVARGELRRG